jgi:hypothetical protein
MEKSLTREMLQGIRDDALELGNNIPNENWQRAYKQLADAADRLDAMEARTIDREDNDSGSVDSP